MNIIGCSFCCCWCIQTGFLEITFVINRWDSQRRSLLSPVIPLCGVCKNTIALELPSNSPLRWKLQHISGKAYCLSARHSPWLDFGIQDCDVSNFTILYNTHLNRAYPCFMYLSVYESYMCILLYSVASNIAQAVLTCLKPYLTNNIFLLFLKQSAP